MQRMSEEIKTTSSTFRALEMQELDRKRISMDIHDTTVQNLTTLIHKTEYVSKLLDIDIVKARLELDSMTSIIRNSIDELREIIYDLRPMSIDDLGLVATVERYIHQMETENDELSCELEVVNDENKKILPIINLTVFRVIQESLVNIKKHAKASKIKIKISYESDILSISIEDNGIGFNIENTNEKKKNFGLSIMNERIKLLSGNINFNSKLEKGTKIEIIVPICEEDTYDTN